MSKFQGLVLPERLCKLKNISNFIGFLTHGLPACSTLPYSYALYWVSNKYVFFLWKIDNSILFALEASCLVAGDM
jgi:hypothetical protein